MNGYSIGKEFKCPQCGSKRFGTSGCLSDAPQGHCHGFNDVGLLCDFTWARNDEDTEVFHEPTTEER